MASSPTTVRPNPPLRSLPDRHSGVVAAALTPCRTPGEPDPSAARRYAARLASHGCDGIFAISSTGELPFLDEDERYRIVAGFREGCPRSCTLYVGVSGLGIKQTRRFANHAAKEGADVAVVMSPFFLKLDQTELYSYVTAIADDCPIPVFIYHHARMPTPFEEQTVARLAEHPNIVGLKDTAGEDARMARLADLTRTQQFSLLQGSEPLLLPTLNEGGHGHVTALAGIAPEWHRELVDTWKRNDQTAAQQSADRIIALWGMLTLEQTKQSFGHFAYSIKLAAYLRGWIDSTASMIPGFVPAEDYTHLLQEHLREVGFNELMKK